MRLYAERRWVFDAGKVRTGYSVVLFAPHGVQYTHPATDLIHELKCTPGVTSIQITFHAHRAAASHSMPPGGFRVAIVNCWDLAAGRRVRAELARVFGLAASRL